MGVTKRKIQQVCALEAVVVARRGERRDRDEAMFEASAEAIRGTSDPRNTEHSCSSLPTPNIRMLPNTFPTKSSLLRRSIMASTSPCPSRWNSHRPSMTGRKKRSGDSASIDDLSQHLYGGSAASILGWVLIRLNESAFERDKFLVPRLPGREDQPSRPARQKHDTH